MQTQIWWPMQTWGMWAYTWVWSIAPANITPINSWSILPSYVPNFNETPEQKHKRYLDDMAKGRIILQQQKNSTTNKVQKANIDLKIKTSILGDYLKDKAFQNWKERYTIPDETYVQQQMKNINAFPTAEADITAYMKWNMDEKTLFRSLDKQYAKSIYAPKLAQTLRQSWFDWWDDMEVINNFLNKTWDEKARQDLINIWVLDNKTEKLTDLLTHPWTKLQEYASTINNSVVSWVLKTIWWLLTPWEKIMQWAIGLEEKVLPWAAPWFTQESLNKTPVQNVTDIALWWVEWWLTSKFPWLTVWMNIASENKYGKPVVEAVSMVNEFVGSILWQIPWLSNYLDMVTPEQRKEIESLLPMALIEWVQKARWKTTPITKLDRLENKITWGWWGGWWGGWWPIVWNMYTRLVNAYPKIWEIIETNLLPVKKQTEILIKRIEWLKTKQEKIVSEIIQPAIKDASAVPAVTDVLKPNAVWKTTMTDVVWQLEWALKEEWANLENLVGWKEKLLKDQWITPNTTIDPRITNIAEIVQKKMQKWWEWLENTPEYQSNMSKIDYLVKQAQKRWLTNTEKQQLKHFFDDEINNLYNADKTVKWSAIEEKALTAERSFLRKDIEVNSWQPNEWKPVFESNEKYAWIKRALAKAKEIEQIIKNSESVPQWVIDYMSRFVALNRLRKPWVKLVARLEKELSNKLTQLKRYQTSRTAAETRLNALTPQTPWKPVVSVPSLTFNPEVAWPEAWVSKTTIASSNWQQIVGSPYWDSFKRWQIVEYVKKWDTMWTTVSKESKWIVDNLRKHIKPNDFIAKEWITTIMERMPSNTNWAYNLIDWKPYIKLNKLNFKWFDDPRAVETLRHEIGHHLDNAAKPEFKWTGKWSTSWPNAEKLTEFKNYVTDKISNAEANLKTAKTAYMKKQIKDFIKYAEQPVELLAEWYRKLWKNIEEVKQDNPYIYDMLTKMEQDHPWMKKFLDTFNWWTELETIPLPIKAK